MPIHGYPGNIITANPTAPTVSAASGVWTTEQQLQAVSQGNWPGYEYPISRSLRFNSADSAYLNRTFGTSTNQNIFTYSAWVKLARAVEATTNYGVLIAARTASTDAGYGILEIYNGVLRFTGWSTVWRSTTQVFRDPSAWYHIVLAVDTTQATAANRIKIYLNGNEITTFGTSNNPTQNTTLGINNNSTAARLGNDDPVASSRYFDGYLTEINFIDGQALTPSSFGLNDPETGIWSPKQYTGTYGTNGFYLNFSDNSNTTAATLGKDSSGNGNNWTPNNFSVTAGTGNDSLVDTPTSYGLDTGVGGEVRGNYCTLNPLNKQSNLTLSNGNLDTSSPAVGTWRSVVGTVAMTSGKWYWEATAGANGAANHYFVGIAATSFNALTDNVFLGSTTDSWSYYGNNGTKYNNSSSAAYGASYTTNDVIGIAYDADAGTLTFYKNGVSQGTAYTGLTGAMVAGTTGYNGSGMYHNFGQRPFAYTAPSGFKALCTQNLPTPTIGATSTTQANRYFDIQLYTGTGSSRSVTGYNFQPEFVWIKGRSGATDHGLYDAVRGVQNQLESNTTTAETTETTGLTAFNSDGFTVGSLAQLNTNTATYVAWAWDAAGSNSTNTSGTITSTVRANTTAGFSVGTYTGTGVNATVGHGLGVAPSFIIVRPRVGPAAWVVYHTSIGNGNFLQLQLTNASAASSTMWNNTSPTSTVFSLGTDPTSNGSGNSTVFYAFAPVAGYSAFGSYTGNGSTDGPFVYTGMRPRYILIKRTTNADNWFIFDTARNSYNVANLLLYTNLANAEATFTSLDILSNGFKIRTSDAGFNASANDYIYAAFAESPFKYALAR